MRLSALWNNGATSYYGEPLFAKSSKVVEHSCDSLFYCEKCRAFLLEEGLQFFNNGFICENCEAEAIDAPYPPKKKHAFVRNICSNGCQRCPVCIDTYLDFKEIVARTRVRESNLTAL